MKKGVRFVELRDAGDPVAVAAEYDRQGADEICFLDITASSDGRKTMLDVVRQTAERVFLPLTVGGGVRSVDDVRALLLRFEGRTFRLVAGADLPRLRDRDDYHVVPQAEAQRVLDGLAATTPAAKTGSFREARKLLAHDWRPPLAPDGIVLLRRVAEPKGPSPKPEPGSAPGRAAVPTASAPAAEEKEQEPLHPCPATLAQASQDGSPFCAACTRHG